MKTTRFKSLLKGNSKALKISLFNAFAILILCYFIDNLPFSFTGGATIGQHFEQIKQFFNPTEEAIPSDLLFVNVAYDRQLTDVNDELGLPKGNIDITDRRKLLDFLSQLKNSDYKYIMLDVSFSNEYKTPEDSALFQLISEMDNIVVAKSENFELADSALARKARYSDYSTLLTENNFVKYEYIRHGEPTMPYQMYKDLYGDSITTFAGLHFFKGKLANRSIVLRFPIKLWNNIEAGDVSDEIGQLCYYNLGSDILDMGVDIPEMAEGKIIVIGDFSENDMHDTYLGKISGPVININAYYGLVNDNLSIPGFEIIFQLILYFLISLFIIKKPSISKILPFIRRIKSKTLIFLLSFIGLTFVLTVIALLWYIFFGLDINILIPSLYFSVVELIVKYNKTVSKQ